MPAISHHHVPSRGTVLKTILRSLPSGQKSYHYNDRGSYSSWVHVEGRSMRWPSFSSLKSSSTGTPGYGEPPRVKISHSNTPKDHLTCKDTMRMTIINRQRHHVSDWVWENIFRRTRHSDGCKCGRTELQAPSTSLVNDPVETQVLYSPTHHLFEITDQNPAGTEIVVMTQSMCSKKIRACYLWQESSL